MAYADGIPIGWCNANDKSVFLRFDFDTAITGFIRGNSFDRVKAVTCFIVAPEYRGKSVPTALLERVIADAKAGGYMAVEGYPRMCDYRETFDYPGPVRLYERMGFVEAARQKNVSIMRKGLDL